jgi:hypothetical protein
VTLRVLPRTFSVNFRMWTKLVYKIFVVGSRKSQRVISLTEIMKSDFAGRVRDFV